MADKKAREMAKIAYQALEEKKAEDIRVINIEQVSVLADYFLIASGTNRNQTQAMADNVEEMLHKAGYQPRQTEGYQTANWILMDYGSVVVHIFQAETRKFYDLERLWKDGRQLDAAAFLPQENA